MTKKKAGKEKWCPLSGDIGPDDDFIRRAREFWGVRQFVRENILHAYRPDLDTIKKARAIYERWDQLQRDPSGIEILESVIMRALDPAVEVLAREECIKDYLLLNFSGLKATAFEVFSILAIYESKIAKNQAWPVELLALAEKYSPDAMLGKKRQIDQARFAKIGAEERKRTTKATHNKWLRAGKDLRQKHKDWKPRSIAKEIWKRFELPEKSFQNLYKIFLKNNV